MKAARIVLIEDNPADVLLVELALKENGVAHEMTKFKSGREGVGYSVRPRKKTNSCRTPFSST
jgi:hypothetical protein